MSNTNGAKSNGKMKSFTSKSGGKVEYELDLSEWTTFRPFARFSAVASQGNMMAVARTYSEVVKKWSLDGDPTDLEAWLDLPKELMSELNTELQTQIVNFFQG